MPRIRVFFQKNHRSSRRETIWKIRRKRNKTKTENILMKYYRIYCYVSEVLVQESKHHIAAEQGIESIRKFLLKH